MHIHIFITQCFFLFIILFINLKAIFLLFIFENKINIHSYIYLLGYV